MLEQTSVKRLTEQPKKEATHLFFPCPLKAVTCRIEVAERISIQSWRRSALTWLIHAIPKQIPHASDVKAPLDLVQSQDDNAKVLSCHTLGKPLFLWDSSVITQEFSHVILNISVVSKKNK